MGEKWESLSEKQRAIIALLGALFLFGIIGQFQSSPQPATRLADEVTVNDMATLPPTTSDATSVPESVTQSASSSHLPPTAVVDGVTYSGQEQIDAMTQAAKDAGMDDATARRTGEEAAMLCNGNPDCLR